MMQDKESLNNKHIFDPDKELDWDKLSKILDSVNDRYRNSQLEMPAYILLVLLQTCKTKKDVKSIERGYKHVTFLGGQEVINQIQNEYKRLGYDDTTRI